MQAVAIDTDRLLAAKPGGISDEEMLALFADAQPGRSNREYLLAIGRAIEARTAALMATQLDDLMSRCRYEARHPTYRDLAEIRPAQHCAHHPV